MSDPATRAAALGSLLLAAVRPGADALLRRPIGWARDLDRLGVDVALPVVNDLGLLLAVPLPQLTIGARRHLGPVFATRAAAADVHNNYVQAIRSLSTDPTIEQIRAM